MKTPELNQVSQMMSSLNVGGVAPGFYGGGMMQQGNAMMQVGVASFVVDDWACEVFPRYCVDGQDVA